MLSQTPYFFHRRDLICTPHCKELDVFPPSLQEHSFFSTSTVSFLQLCLCVRVVCLRTSAVGLPHPAAAVGAHDAHKLFPHQFVLVWALQRDDCAHTGTVSLDDLLGSQSWKGHGFALSMSPRLTCKSKGAVRGNKVSSASCKKNKKKTVGFQRSDQVSHGF